MFGFCTVLLVLTSIFSVLSIPVDSDDPEIATASSGDIWNVDNLDNPISPDVLMEAVTQSDCSSSTSEDTSDANIVKRKALQCPIEDTPLFPELKTYLNGVHVWRKKKEPSVIPSDPQNQGAVDYSHSHRPFFDHDHSCDEYQQQSIHVTCRGPEYGFTLPNSVAVVLNCAKGSCES